MLSDVTFSRNAYICTSIGAIMQSMYVSYNEKAFELYEKHVGTVCSAIQRPYRIYTWIYLALKHTCLLFPFLGSYSTGLWSAYYVILA